LLLQHDAIRAIWRLLDEQRSLNLSKRRSGPVIPAGPLPKMQTSN